MYLLLQNNDKRTDLFLFIAITFLFSWLVWLPSVLDSQEIISLPQWVGLVTNIATFGPMIGAVVVVGIRSGKAGIKNLLAKMLNTKFKKTWWIAIILLIPVISGLSYAIAVPITGDTWETGFAWSLLVNVIIMFFVGGPLGEELGWRGYMLERLQKKRNALASSLIVGFIWGVWHLPLHFMTGTTQEYIPIWAFILLQMVISILYTWIYNNTKSVLAVIIFHWVGNAAAMLIPFWQKGFIWGEITLPNYWIPSIGMLIVFGLNLIVAVAIIAVFGMKNLRKEVAIQEPFENEV